MWGGMALQTRPRRFHNRYACLTLYKSLSSAISAISTTDKAAKGMVVLIASSSSAQSGEGFFASEFMCVQAPGRLSPTHKGCCLFSVSSPVRLATVGRESTPSESRELSIAALSLSLPSQQRALPVSSYHSDKANPAARLDPPIHHQCSALY